MKQLLTLAILTLSICLHAQGDIMQLVNEVNGQPDRITGYSKMVTLSYSISYEDDASIDTTLTNSDGSESELTLTKKTITLFGSDTDIQYEIDMTSGDTSMVTTTTYNSTGKISSQNQNLGDDELSAMFNSTKNFTYDDQNRVTQMINKAGNDGEESGATFVYHSDGLPQSLSMNMGMGIFNINREEMDGYIKYELAGEMSPEMTEMLAMMGKSADDMPQEFFEVREKNGLYEVKHMKEVGDEKVLTHKSTTIRDKAGNLYEEINYNGGEIVTHKKHEYVDGKLSTIIDAIEGVSKTINYDGNGNPLVEYDRFAKSVMTYNKDGMLASKANNSMFSDEITGLDVIKYFK